MRLFITNLRSLLSICLLFFVTASCSTETAIQDNFPEPGLHSFQVESDGSDRDYFLYLPAGYDSAGNYPVIFLFHGGGGQAMGIFEEAPWPDLADERGIVLIVPEGTRGNPDRPASFANNPQSWNDGSDREALDAVERDVDDVAFVRSLIDDVRDRLESGTQALFATGFSNGASMSFRVARELDGYFTAIAPVAGSDWLPELIPDNPPPVLYITGTEDPLNPFEGGDITLAGNFYGTKPPVEEMISKWALLHNCSDTAETETTGEIRKYDYNCSSSPDPVSMLALIGHGHHWPGADTQLPRFIAGPNSTDLNATETIMEFFDSFIGE